MTATSHAVLGTVIAAKVADPLLAIPLALLSHIAADLFPHWDAGTHYRKKSRMQLTYESAADVLLGFAICYLINLFLFPETSFAYTFVMIIAAQFFDWLMVPYFYFKIDYPPFNWAYRIQHRLNSKLDKPWGIINQIIVISAIVILAKFFI